MCILCTYIGSLHICSIRQEERESSPPLPPPRPVVLGERPTTSSPPASVSRNSGRSHGTNDARRSVESGRSETSQVSNETLSTIKSLQSLRSLVNQISNDLYPQEALAANLTDWMRQLDPAAYKPDKPWPPHVQEAYDEYKRLAKETGTARQTFLRTVTRTWKKATDDEHLEQARMAVAWGQAALKAGETRLNFINRFRNAYDSVAAIETHIKAGEDALKSGRGAVKAARDQYEKLWVKASRAADPAVFQ
ncbi:hypothetical protein F5Y17DRAFT_376489 [Xylariaceae sp. FL0594]|nr:hypothetical protein F5Y17DRAFT_376489 [Xylariaceae sp. FL0594]